MSSPTTQPSDTVPPPSECIVTVMDPCGTEPEPIVTETTEVVAVGLPPVPPSTEAVAVVPRSMPETGAGEIVGTSVLATMALVAGTLLTRMAQHER